jgi:hypothetical protein
VVCSLVFAAAKKHIAENVAAVVTEEIVPAAVVAQMIPTRLNSVSKSATTPSWASEHKTKLHHQESFLVLFDFLLKYA